MADKIHMSLDDIIKSNKKTTQNQRRTGPTRSGGNRPNNTGNNKTTPRNGAGPIKASNTNRQTRRQTGPYTRPAPVNNSNGNDRWPHDKFDGPNRIAKINLSNLHYRVTDQDLRDLFSEFGKIKSANVFYDKTGRSLGNAQVVFVTYASALAAKKKYNGILLDGRNMVIALEGENKTATGGGSFNENRLQKPRPTQNNSNQSNNNTRGNQRNNTNNRNAGQNKGNTKPKGQKPKRAAPPTQAELDADLDAYISKQNS